MTDIPGGSNTNSMDDSFTDVNEDVRSDISDEMIIDPLDDTIQATEIAEHAPYLSDDQYIISSSLYHGPINELIRLSVLGRVDLFELRLTLIVDDFIEFAKASGTLSLETLTKFIKELTALIELKSRMLLPDKHEEELFEEPLPSELIARQIEYRKFKNASAHIAGLIEHSRSYISRDADIEKGIKHHIFSGKIDIFVLKAFAERIVNIYNFKVAEAKHMIPTPILLEKFADFVNTKLSSQRTLLFRDLMRELGNKQEILALFLALLNLYKNGEIDMKQEELFGDIEIKKHEDQVPVTA